MRRDHIQYNLEKLKKGGETAAWRIVNEVTGKQKGSELPMPKGCSTDVDAANATNDFYVRKVLDLRQNLSARTLPEAVTSPGGGFAFKSVGFQEVRKAILQLPAKTSVGVDSIPITIFKNAWAALAPHVVHIINLVIKTGQWPTAWKEAVIKPALKAGKPPLEVSSYRPVALLCSVSKICERVLYNQLVSFIEAHCILPDEQHGYRASRSVDTALASMMGKIAYALDRGMKIGMAAFDFSSAFDTIEASVLDSKLTWAGQEARELIRDYLLDGRQKVVWNGQISKTNLIKFGVRQGSILGPLLYILLTGDLPRIVTDNIEPDAQAAVKLYADDTSGVIFAKTWEQTDKAMTTIAENLERYANDNGLHLNKGKTQTLRLGHKDTSTMDTLNVLGVELGRTGGFSRHHTTMLTELRQRAGAVRRLSTAMPRGKLLSEIARSLVIGKVQCNAWVTRKARLDPTSKQDDDVATQRVLNDLARNLLGVKRIDRHRASNLADRANIPTLNQITVKGSALNAWKAENGGPLRDMLQPYDSRTRSADLHNLRKPTSTRCLAARNMSEAWNFSKELREAKTLPEAKRVASKLAHMVRHN